MSKRFNEIPLEHPSHNPSKRLFRFHSGGTVMESVAHAIEVTDLESVAKLCRERGWEFENIELKPYAYDERINWLTYIVTVDGMAVGYTNHSLVDNVIEIKHN